MNKLEAVKLVNRLQAEFGGTENFASVRFSTVFILSKLPFGQAKLVERDSLRGRLAVFSSYLGKNQDMETRVRKCLLDVLESQPSIDKGDWRWCARLEGALKGKTVIESPASDKLDAFAQAISDQAKIRHAKILKDSLFLDPSARGDGLSLDQMERVFRSNGDISEANVEIYRQYVKGKRELADLDAQRVDLILKAKKEQNQLKEVFFNPKSTLAKADREVRMRTEADAVVQNLHLMKNGDSSLFMGTLGQKTIGYNKIMASLKALSELKTEIFAPLKQLVDLPDNYKKLGSFLFSFGPKSSRNEYPDPKAFIETNIDVAFKELESRAGGLGQNSSFIQALLNDPTRELPEAAKKRLPAKMTEELDDLWKKGAAENFGSILKPFLEDRSRKLPAFLQQSLPSSVSKSLESGLQASLLGGMTYLSQKLPPRQVTEFLGLLSEALDLAGGPDMGALSIIVQIMRMTPPETASQVLGIILNNVHLIGSEAGRKEIQEKISQEIKGYACEYGLQAGEWVNSSVADWIDGVRTKINPDILSLIDNEVDFVYSELWIDYIRESDDTFTLEIYTSKALANKHPLYANEGKIQWPIRISGVRKEALDRDFIYRLLYQFVEPVCNPEFGVCVEDAFQGILDYLECSRVSTQGLLDDLRSCTAPRLDPQEDTSGEMAMVRCLMSKPGKATLTYLAMRFDALVRFSGAERKDNTLNILDDQAFHTLEKAHKQLTTDLRKYQALIPAHELPRYQATLDELSEALDRYSILKAAREARPVQNPFHLYDPLFEQIKGLLHKVGVNESNIAIVKPTLIWAFGDEVKEFIDALSLSIGPAHKNKEVTAKAHVSKILPKESMESKGWLREVIHSFYFFIAVSAMKAALAAAQLQAKGVTPFFALSTAYFGYNFLLPESARSWLKEVMGVLIQKVVQLIGYLILRLILNPEQVEQIYAAKGQLTSITGRLARTALGKDELSFELNDSNPPTGLKSAGITGTPSVVKSDPPENAHGLLSLVRFCSVADTTYEGVESVTGISFKPFDLRFNVKEKRAHAEGEDLKGFYIAPKQFSPRLNRFGRYLLLEDYEGNQKLLLPEMQWDSTLMMQVLKGLGPWASASAFLDSPRGDLKSTYRVFNLTSNGALMSDHPDDMLFLLTLYWLQGDQKSALHACKEFEELCRHQVLTDSVYGVLVPLLTSPTNIGGVIALRQRVLAAIEENQMSRKTSRPQLPLVQHAAIAGILLLDLTTEKNPALTELQEWFLFKAFYHHLNEIAKLVINSEEARLYVASQTQLPPLYEATKEVRFYVASQTQLLPLYKATAALLLIHHLDQFGCEAVPYSLLSRTATTVLTLLSGAATTVLTLNAINAAIPTPAPDLKKLANFLAHYVKKSSVLDQPILQMLLELSVVPRGMTDRFIQLDNRFGQERTTLQKVSLFAKDVLFRTPSALPFLGFDPDWFGHYLGSSQPTNFVKESLRLTLQGATGKLLNLEALNIPDLAKAMQNPITEEDVEFELSMIDSEKFKRSFFTYYSIALEGKKNVNWDKLKMLLSLLQGGAMNRQTRVLCAYLSAIVNAGIALPPYRGSKNDPVRLTNFFETINKELLESQLINHGVRNTLYLDVKLRLKQVSSKAVFAGISYFVPAIPIGAFTWARIREAERALRSDWNGTPLWKKISTIPWIQDVSSSLSGQAETQAAKALAQTVSLSPTLNSLQAEDDVFDQYLKDLSKGNRSNAYQQLTAYCDSYQKALVEGRQKLISSFTSELADPAREAIFKQLTLCFLKVDYTSALKGVSLESKDLENLDTALALHLIRWTRLRQMQRALDLLNKDSAFLADKRIQKELNTTRAYKLASPLARTLLVAEFERDQLISSEQWKHIHELCGENTVVRLNEDEAFYMAVLNAQLADGKQLVMNIFPKKDPDSLGVEVRQLGGRLFQQTYHTFRFDQAKAVTLENLTAFELILQNAVKAREVIILAKEEIQLLELTFVDQMKSHCHGLMSDEKLLMKLQKVLHMIRTKGRAIGAIGHDLFDYRKGVSLPNDEEEIERVYLNRIKTCMQLWFWTPDARNGDWQNRLATQMADLFVSDKEKCEELTAFFSSTLGPVPEWIRIHKKYAEMALVRGIITVHLPSALKNEPVNPLNPYDALVKKLFLARDSTSLKGHRSDIHSSAQDFALMFAAGSYITGKVDEAGTYPPHLKLAPNSLPVNPFNQIAYAQALRADKRRKALDEILRATDFSTMKKAFLGSAKLFIRKFELDSIKLYCGKKISLSSQFIQNRGKALYPNADAIHTVFAERIPKTVDVLSGTGAF